jgi:hypothetical protein
MDKDDVARIAGLLEQIRDNQAEQLALVKRASERTERIQDRAEALQAKGAGIVRTARLAIAVILPVVVLLIAYVSWLMFR